MYSDRLKALRENLKFTQEDLADSVGVSKRTVISWEKGKGISDIYLLKLAKSLSTSTDYLLGLTDDPTPAHVAKDALLPHEREVISHLRRGDTLGAIRAITNREYVKSS